MENNFAVVDLCNAEVVRNVSSEKEAQDAVVATNGASVDRAGARVFDGEYQQWFPMAEYVGRYPNLAWLEKV